MPLENIFIVDSLPSGRETLEWALERAGAEAITSGLAEATATATSLAAKAQLAVVALRTSDFRELELVRALAQPGPAPRPPVLVLGPEPAREKATLSGAALFLSTPLYIRDAINAARLAAAAGKDSRRAEFEVKERLALFEGLYQLVRALLSLQRSFIVELRNGRHRGELRFASGLLSAAHLDNLQGTTAFHRMLLWEDGDVVIRARNQVRRSGQFSATPDTLILEADRFLRDFAHEAGDLGTARTIYQQDLTRVAQRAAHVPDEVSPVFRLFDGQRDLAAVVQDSPFPVFDTIRIVRRLVQAGALVRRPEEEAAPQARTTEPTSGVIAIAGWNQGPKDDRGQGVLLEPKRRRKITASRLVVERPSSLSDGPDTPLPVALAVSGELGERTPSPAAAVPALRPKRTPSSPGPSLSAGRTGRTGPQVTTAAPSPRPLSPAAQLGPPSRVAGPSSPRGVPPSPSPLPASPFPLSPGAPPPRTSSPRVSAAAPVAAKPIAPTNPPRDPSRARNSATIAAVAGEIGGDRNKARVPAPRDERTTETRSGEIRAPILLTPRMTKPAGISPDQAPSIVVDAAQVPPAHAAPGASAQGAPVSAGEQAGPTAPGAAAPALSPSASAVRRARGAAAPFDDVEADFFAREADLYRQQAVEDFADLDKPAGTPGGKRRP